MLDALTLDQLRTFVAVAESGSFRAAATRLARVQSAVSHALANLEAQLGVTLFDRGGHRPVLTDEGQALLVNARDILLRVDAMRARARGLSQRLELELSIVVDNVYPIAQVGAALTQMHQHYPSVAIRLAVEPLGGPLAALLEQRATLAVMVGENFRDPRVALEALSGAEMVAVIAPHHPLARAAEQGPLTLADLADHLQIVQTDPTPLSAGRDFGVLSPRTCRVNTQETKYAMIMAGLGWGRLPSWQIARDLGEGRLLRLNTRALGRDAQVAYEAYLVHRIDQPLGLAAQAFREALVRIARQGEASQSSE